MDLQDTLRIAIPQNLGGTSVAGAVVTVVTWPNGALAPADPSGYQDNTTLDPTLGRNLVYIGNSLFNSGRRPGPPNTTDQIQEMDEQPDHSYNGSIVHTFTPGAIGVFATQENGVGVSGTNLFTIFTDATQVNPGGHFVERVWAAFHTPMGWTSPPTTLLYTSIQDPALLDHIDTFLCSEPVGSGAARTTLDVAAPLFVALGLAFATVSVHFMQLIVPLQVTVSCPVLNSGTVGVAFTSTVIVGGGTAPFTFAITAGALPPGLTLDPATGIISGIPTMAGTFPYTVQVTDANANVATADCSISIVAPVVVSAPPGRGFIHVTLNAFDACLGREYLLARCIDRELKSCKKPDCFLVPERAWGGNWGDDEEVPVGPPAGAIAFNPTGNILLPAAAAGDVVIFSFIVPFGYDGIILGQFHGYYPTPIGPIIPAAFIEGNGDIIWRLSAEKRFVRDCGQMLVTLGTIRSQSPVAGGIQLRSGNLVEYIVNAPNLSGSLTAGQGSILAGLHGYFYPRV